MAFLKGSRYADLTRFDSASTFEGVRPRPIGPATPVLEHTVAMKERLDALAQEYYRNPRSWVRLAEANLGELFAEDLLWQPDPEGENGREKLGQVLLVPRREEDRG
jgi:hypothetical protein